MQQSSTKKKYVKINIENLRLRTMIGFSQWELGKLQDVIINIKFRYNAIDAIQSDEARHALNYKAITKKVILEVEGSTCNLLETLTNKVYELIKANDHVEDLSVTIEKPHALRFSDTVKATIED